MGVPLVIIHFNGMFPYKPSSYWGTPSSENHRICVYDMDIKVLDMFLWTHYLCKSLWILEKSAVFTHGVACCDACRNVLTHIVTLLRQPTFIHGLWSWIQLVAHFLWAKSGSPGTLRCCPAFRPKPVRLIHENCKKKNREVQWSRSVRVGI